MIIKWVTGGYYSKDVIRRLECTRETEKSVWHTTYGRETRREKVTSYECIHDSWENAHRYLIVDAQGKELAAVYHLDDVRKKLVALSLMTKPDEAGVKP